MSALGIISVLQVCKLNANYTIEFHNCSGKKILSSVYQKMFLKL